MVQEEKWVWAIVGPILLGAAWLWVDANGFASLIGLLCIFGIWFAIVYWSGGTIGGLSKSADDEITIIDKDGKPTRYVKKD